MITTLTPRRQAVMAAIVNTCIAHGGVPPTIREIGDAVGIASTSVVNYHLKILDGAGLIRLPDESYVSRGIEVVGATWTPPAHLAHLVATGEAAAA